MRSYPTINGKAPDRREIDPTRWRWNYVFINKDADKNAKRVETLSKNLLTLQQKLTKYDDICIECYSKVLMNLGYKYDDYSSYDINHPVFDKAKSIETLRRKYNKTKELYTAISDKISEATAEIKKLNDEGTQREVIIKSDDIVGAYDIQSYVKMHPEMFNKK